MNYKPTIGLEIHIELATKSKMFCDCRNDPDENRPNVNICPICTSQPGTLPVINKEAVKMVDKTALALNCQIQKNTKFERKNYFYPDLPKGYQISQYNVPLGKGGYLEISTTEENAEAEKSNIKNFTRPSFQRKFGRASISKMPTVHTQQIKNQKTNIRRVHLEEDTGKLVHSEGENYSLVDFNRAGIPLMELVTEPDIHSAQEAREFVKELQLILRYLGVSGANMEKGEMRVEVNISLLPLKSQIPSTKSQTNSKFQIPNSKLGTKVEIKNLNSVKAMEKAIEYETERQSEVLERGEKIVQETRGWHDKKAITFSQREKEEAHDYRYFPEPDLPSLKVGEEFLHGIKLEIPELPFQRKERFRKEYQLSGKEIEFYVSQKDLGEYFEKVVSELRDWVKAKRVKKEVKEDEFQKLIKLASNYISTDLQALLKEASVEGEDFLITPENFAEFLTMIYTGEISSKIAKIVLKEMFATGGDPSQIIEEKSLQQITNTRELEKVIKEVINKNPKPVDDYKKGKEAALHFLVGQAMAKTRGRASPETVLKGLKEKLV